jgi:hypothetical protein
MSQYSKSSQSITKNKYASSSQNSQTKINLYNCIMKYNKLTVFIFIYQSNYLN